MTAAPGYIRVAVVQGGAPRRRHRVREGHHGHGNPFPFLRKGSREELRRATGGKELPALKLSGGTILAHSRAILSWVERER